MAAFLALHIRLIGVSQEELRFWIIAGVFGTITDSIFAAVGFIDYRGGYPGIDWLAPFWITGMWVGFTATLHHSLVIMRDHAWLAFLLGAIFGPVSYLTAESVGAIAIHVDLLTSSLVLGILWGVLMPFLYRVSARLGMPQQS